MPTLTELELVGYYTDPPKPSEPGWLGNLFKAEPEKVNSLPVYGNSTADRIPGGSSSKAPTTEVRPGDLPSKTGKPRVE